MDISLLNILRTVSWDFRRDMAQNYANALKSSIEIHLQNNTQKQEGYFLSKKGTKSMKGDFQDKLYVGNIHAIERHLFWNDEELADDDQVVDVVYIDGPVTRDGGGCSYGTKDYRDQVLYANTLPQVVGHVFIINTPGGETACRKDYELMIADCRAKNKPTVAFIDGMCCSSGVNLASRCDRTIVMNPKDDYGCIGSMAAFWATPDGAVDQDGSRYVEIVGDESPNKNDWWREAAAGDYEKLQTAVNKDTDDFINTVRENRPLVEDNMLTGTVFEAQEVMPALVDEVGDMSRAIDCVFDLASGELTAARFAKDENDSKTEKPEEEQPEEEPSDDPEEQPNTEAEAEPKKEPEPDPNKQPAPKGPEDVPEVGKSDNKEDATAKAAIADLDKKIADKDKVIAGKDKAIADKDMEIANLKAQLDKSKEESNDAIADLKKEIANLHQEVKELASEPTPMTGGAEAPKDNGTGAPETGAVKSIVTANMSADEIRNRLREQDKAIATKRRHL